MNNTEAILLLDKYRAACRDTDALAAAKSVTEGVAAAEAFQDLWVPVKDREREIATQILAAMTGSN